jgi:hypothetical protein
MVEVVVPERMSVMHERRPAMDEVVVADEMATPCHAPHARAGGWGTSPGRAWGERKGGDDEGHPERQADLEAFHGKTPLLPGRGRAA